MASIAEKFYNLMSIKRNRLIADYEELVYEEYPKFLKTGNNEDINKFEKQFAKRHIDLKMEFYSLDCQYNMLKLMLNKIDYTFYFELLIAFEDLSWLENLCKEFDCNVQESKKMIKLFLKQIIPFYIGDNARIYNMAIEARKNARLSYVKDVLSSIERTIEILQNPTIEIATVEYLKKRDICVSLNEIIKKSKMDAIFSHPELLKELGLSEEFLNTICEKITETKIEAPYKKEQKLRPVVCDIVVDDVKLIEERMSKYLLNDEPLGVIEGEDFQKFLVLAKKLYPIEKVSLLKEKVLLNNKKLKSEKRENIKSKIIHENDRAYYEYLVSLDLTDPYYLPYASYIESTIALIEGYIIDLTEAYNEELAELYLEEIGILLDNMKSCIPYRKM